MSMNETFNRRNAAALLVVLGALLAITPAGMRNSQHLTPREIVATIANRSDHVTAEELAEWLIDKRPDVLVVDIRQSEEYAQYHIPGSINIPLALLFDQESMEGLDTDEVVVLYSNGGTHAAQAWVILQQMGIESYVLLGGLNYWVEAILNPTPPDDLAADSEILKYQFQKSASGYFTGSGVAVKGGASRSPATTPPKIRKGFKRKKKSADEGC